MNVNETLNSLFWNRAPKHRNKGAHVVETAVMSAVLSFYSGAASRMDVMKAANIPGGEFTLEGCTAKDEKRMSHSMIKTKTKEKGEGKEEKPSLQLTKEKHPTPVVCSMKSTHLTMMPHYPVTMMTIH